MLMAVGLYAYMRMPITRYPNVDIPVVMLLLESPGTRQARSSSRWRSRWNSASKRSTAPAMC